VIARAIMRSHEGVLLAENLETGGALFTLELPMSESASYQPALPPTEIR